MKVVMILVSLIVGPIAGSGLFNKYWLPASIRSYVIPPKYSSGACLASKRWGVNPKIVIGHKEKKNGSGYLLKDHDRYQHMQYISSEQVDLYAHKVSCR